MPKVLIIVVLSILSYACAARSDAPQGPARQPLTIGRVVGAHGNAWNAAALGIGAANLSTAVDTELSAYCSIFGDTSTAATITVQYSGNNTNFYNSATNTGAVTGNFGVNIVPGARYIRLSSNNAAATTMTATVMCRG